MEWEELRGDSEFEADSDHEDCDTVVSGGYSGAGWMGHPFHHFHIVSII